ncbi:hypothetical protein NDU88_004175 [Pleurodeles waltl]|uniref:Uncharacterized protein n=1 Tax=Pleurodeles waltl TaxID=8319 RepID=A0AAV7M6U0_PLEWA|nr:hypothetical protein NDU88_004175 [Pleurodeles waltl]
MVERLCEEIICYVLCVLLHATARHRMPNQYRVLLAVVFLALERSPVTVERLCEVPEDATVAVFFTE